MQGRDDRTYRFVYNPASHVKEAESIKRVKLIPFEDEKCRDGHNPKTPETPDFMRMLTQQQDLELVLGEHEAASDMQPLKEKWSCYEVKLSGSDWEKAKSLNGDPLFQQHLYLFNVVIALEWEPSWITLQQLRLAAQRASHFLYDVTDGNMAIGTVVIGGPALMHAADIQVMASNRLHPRSWVDALNRDYKFMPIRIGRGLWQKNTNFLLSWDTPEGYRALIHEWGHYAFGLSDEYLTRVWLSSDSGGTRRWGQADIAVAVPQVALPVETLMASTQISEFARRESIVPQLQKRFPCVKMDEKRPLEGPDSLPLPLPTFSEDPKLTPSDVVDIVLEAQQIRRDLPRTRGATYWIYILQGQAAEGLPENIIAQGKIGVREREAGFRLLGARVGDQLVIIRQTGTTVRVLAQTIRLDKNKKLVLDGWQDLTPPVLNPIRPFFVDVIPEPLKPSTVVEGHYATHAELRVAVEQPGSDVKQMPEQVCLYPSGSGAVPVTWHPEQGLSDAKPVKSLDGHVLLRWPQKDAQSQARPLFIANYSQGGGPLTSGGRGTLPITAGSSEGNAMVFFRDNADSGPNTQPQSDPGLRIVTTMLPVGQPVLDDGSQARSYIFSLAANDLLVGYPASLVLFYDRESPAQDMDLLIYRWDRENTRWMPLRTYTATEFPYVAVPIAIEAPESAPGLLEGYVAAPIAAEAPAQGAKQAYILKIERYRIFLTPRR